MKLIFVVFWVWKMFMMMVEIRYVVMSKLKFSLGSIVCSFLMEFLKLLLKSIFCMDFFFLRVMKY